MKTLVNTNSLKSLADAIREKISYDGSLAPSQMPAAIMSIGEKEEYQPTQHITQFQGDPQKVYVEEQTLKDIANAIRTKTDSSDEMNLAQMTLAVQSIETKAPEESDDSGAYIEIMDDKLCWFYSGILGQDKLIAEANIFVPSSGWCYNFPFLIGCAQTGSWTSGGQSAPWTNLNALSPICFHNTSQTVFREGLYKINQNYYDVTDKWMRIKGDHTDYISDRDGLTVHHYVNDVEIGRQLLGIGWSYKNPPAYNLTIFAANIDNGSEIRYRMPTGTKMKWLKVWKETTLIGEFVPAKTSSGEACLYDKVTKRFIYKQGSGTIEVVGDVAYQE